MALELLSHEIYLRVASVYLTLALVSSLGSGTKSDSFPGNVHAHYPTKNLKSNKRSLIGTHTSPEDDQHILALGLGGPHHLLRQTVGYKFIRINGLIAALFTGGEVDFSRLQFNEFKLRMSIILTSPSVSLWAISQFNSVIYTL